MHSESYPTAVSASRPPAHFAAIELDELALLIEGGADIEQHVLRCLYGPYEARTADPGSIRGEFHLHGYAKSLLRLTEPCVVFTAEVAA